ncbi:hypothetical protein GLW00_20365, partial [Halobacillus litoralis]|nr:hypothetical protein [Halobacillus litoralis]
MLRGAPIAAKAKPLVVAWPNSFLKRAPAPSWPRSMATSPNNPPLAGRRILVSRPEPRAEETRQALEQAGACSRALPLIAIQPRTLDGRERSLIQELDNFRKIIAVSPNAARLLLEQADDWWPQWPVGLEWWGPGEGTARV